MGFWEAFLNWLRRYIIRSWAAPSCLVSRGFDLLRIAAAGVRGSVSRRSGSSSGLVMIGWDSYGGYDTKL